MISTIIELVFCLIMSVVFFVKAKTVGKQNDKYKKNAFIIDIVLAIGLLIIALLCVVELFVVLFD